MPETQDLREVPLEQLTKQQIRSRLHLIRDEQVRLKQEQLELDRMENALMKEMWSRND
ncbi:hypothetical protein SIPHO041v1_p0071 [Vibrio phage 234P1]|nr:hypothetical protein SIPHO036v1_120009 [Vibrio phage 70E38.1]QZI87982.1 hypothetical protein SIPHO041v1_p0071 [Vibrio phage 234P1]QZI88152.1 hypothetical protein SIPHO035v1_p0061 [Vibrio phage 234P7B]QZI88379.1 hypothetical protein SIPHO082v1_p0102 [Vibrio phage 294E48.1]QZI88522.1 hypothetical protein SIPHO037v1_p0081 [Vibrio phage 70E35.2]QZI88705.1 hypothetical protein SIPHO039v1_p0076 [Vibrio phage 70E35.5a]QZI88890.1 hypothetical protein SIPHO040v1_p0077 [Vibrio phage 70E35.6]QZI8913